MKGERVSQLIASNNLTVVVGLGATGLSVARFLARRGEPFVAVDTRTAPPGLEEFRRMAPDVPVELGELNAATLLGANRIVVSPGLDTQHPALRRARDQGVALCGDIELFAAAARAPVVAITGSNGKSTVTTLVGEMARAAGKNVGVGGNLGTPALDLLVDDRDLYVLELSSFQLELVHHLNAHVATVLNLSPDHMDRYAALAHYHTAKHRIFRGAGQVVVNRDDALSRPLVPATVKYWTFGSGVPDFNGFGIITWDGEAWLAFEFKPLMPVDDVRIKGQHNIANALAALALGHAAALPMDRMLATLKNFAGLPHRCQTVATSAGVTWIDDSKATNVGAAIAAVNGFAQTFERIVLIAGGQGKGQDFEPLRAALVGRARQVVLLGEDAPRIEHALHGDVPTVFATSIEAAVQAAARVAMPGDAVLLSPACASLDMFASFAERGRRFAAAVEALA